MDNYKIKVKDEAESKEAQELFFELGYSWLCCGKYYNRIGNYTFITAYPDEMLLRMGWGGDTDKELTLPQLQDLVVLKRKNPDDGNYRLFISDSQGELNLYKTADDVFYVFSKELKGWDKSRAVNINTEGLVKKGEVKAPALISGAEALRALADGKEVEGFSEENEEWIPIVYFSVQEVVNGLYKFRLKPQTIKLELELPKPFEPEEDCHVYILDDGKTDGYRRYSYEVHGDKGNTFIGIWRTEEEIKQVVEQLRKIRGTNS
ncbi:TPA: hypothetical protein R7O71_003257 [Acinetobacter baumannii]|nr:hypothetical protein [Acinetobacter baumannii]